ncbi:MAG: alpha/beta fold hydrolase [Solobacterium sp.]|nr:alpha/beta fold hydrolase [Solobacterium sp.]
MKRPMIYGHRGASGSAPENTLEAFKAAAETGAEGVELDIQLTKDGYIVVIHDETIDRTSDGTGYVKDMTLDELRQYNYNNHKEGFPFCMIPLIEDVFEILRPYGLCINIELKTGIFDYEGIEEKIVQSVHANYDPAKIIYSSFNHYSVMKIKELDPGAACAFLYEDGYMDIVEYAKKYGVQALHPHFCGLRAPGLIRDALDRGLDINVWGVDTDSQYHFCMMNGINIVITNYPDRAREYFSRYLNPFADYMRSTVLPCLEENVSQQYIESDDGVRINTYRMINPEEKAAILILHGFCEFFGKYHEMAYRLYEQGFSVFFAEMRGHGYSERTTQFEDGRVGVQSFDEYLADVHAVMEQVVIPYSKTGHCFLFGHSMGGAIGVLYMEEHPDAFECAVLSAPMLKVNYGIVPDSAVKAMTIASYAVDMDERFAPGQHAFRPDFDPDHSNAQDRDRYAYQFNMRCDDTHYQTWGSTWSWVRAASQAAEKALRNAYSVKTPVLLCQAGLDSMVREEGQKEFASKAQKVTLLRYENAKHELCNANETDREKFYKDILIFFNAYAGKK